MKKLLALLVVCSFVNCSEDKPNVQSSPIIGEWGMVMRANEVIRDSMGFANMTPYEKPPEILKITNDSLIVWRLTETATTTRRTRYHIDSATVYLIDSNQVFGKYSFRGDTMTIRKELNDGGKGHTTGYYVRFKGSLPK